MLPTESLGWNGLQALKSRSSGRLAKFTRRGAPVSRPRKSQNDAIFFESDLRDVLSAKPVVINLSQKDYDDMDHMALDLLASLNDMANLNACAHFTHLIEPPEVGIPDSCESKSPENRSPERSKPNHDIAILGAKFPRLSALMDFLVSLEASRSLHAAQLKFNLTAGPGLSLFTLPPGDAGSVAMDHVKRWKAFLDRLAVDTEPSQGLPLTLPQATQLLAEERTGDQFEKRASIVVDAMFKEFRKLSCAKEATHEIRLRVSDELYTGPCQPTLDMFVSCCPGGIFLWHEAQCGSFPVEIDVAKVSMCTAIRQAMEKRIKLHLLVRPQGLFDITDKRPPIPLPSDNFSGESLSELFNQKAFRPITPNDYQNGKVKEKFDFRRKAEIALALSRCLIDFFDEELTSHSWTPDNIYFQHTPAANKSSHRLYVTLRPKPSKAKSPDLLETFKVGNPVLLSFAKLLLEIESGKEICMEIHPENKANESGWGILCAYLDDERINSSNKWYLEAVKGCLHLCNKLPKAQDWATESATSKILRKIMHQEVVQKLELIVNPQNSKRKRLESVSECPPPKKPSTSLLPSMDSREGLFASPGSTATPTPTCGMRLALRYEPADEAALRQNIKDTCRNSKTPVPLRRGGSEEEMADEELEPMAPFEELGTQCSKVSLYDEYDEENTTDRRKAEAYFKSLENSSNKYIIPLMKQPIDKLPPKLRKPIKIAIVDSGIDMSDPWIKARAKQIQGMRNWTDSDPDNCRDTYGHGTQVVRLVVRVAPAVEVYVARVSTGKQIDRKDTGRIAEAIDWATGVWQVDIISMSLGLDGEEEKVKRALDRVLNPQRGDLKRIVIAAAANWGGNQAIAFPGCHKGVICIHSTDGFGNPSSSNPTVRNGTNFAVLGLSIKTSVKVKSKKEPGAGLAAPVGDRPKRKEAYISGTSYATPIAAGIAANVLEFARHNLALSEGEQEMLYSSWGMRLLFEEMGERRKEHHYIYPWKLFDGKRKGEEIAQTIQDILRGLKRRDT